MRYLRKGGGVPKEILFAPPKLDFDDNPYFKRFTVEKDKLIIDRSGLNWIFIVLGGIFSFVVVLYYMKHGFTLGTMGTSTHWLIIESICNIIFLSCIYMFLQGFLGYKKVFIFDRAKGTVTYPEDGWFRTKTIPFDDACFVFSPVSRQSPTICVLVMARSLGISTVGISNYKYPRELLSLLVWYMDKNRPLPPGDKFDPFRQEDYRRRQAAGFPMPLYPATVRVPDIDGKEPCYRNTLKLSKRVNFSKKERKNRKK